MHASCRSLDTTEHTNVQAQTEKLRGDNSDMATEVILCRNRPLLLRQHELCPCLSNSLKMASFLQLSSVVVALVLGFVVTARAGPYAYNDPYGVGPYKDLYKEKEYTQFEQQQTHSKEVAHSKAYHGKQHQEQCDDIPLSKEATCSMVRRASSASLERLWSPDRYLVLRLRID